MVDCPCAPSSETHPHPDRGRRGGPPRRECFAQPTGPNRRRYEALRGYLYEGLTIEEAAAGARYSTATLRSAVRDFRAGKNGFFVNPRPGPTRAPAKNAGPEKILQLRREGHNAAQITELLAGTATPLNHTGVAEVINEAGLGRTDPTRRQQPTAVPGPPHQGRAARLHRTARTRQQQGRRAAAHPAPLCQAEVRHRETGKLIV